jgi:hypothetical protein
MENIHEYEKDLASIRNMMERSAKFISLSGLSGILAGFYGLVGAIAAYFVVHYPISPLRYRIYSIQEPNTLWKLIAIAGTVLLLSIATGFWLSSRKAKKNNVTIWNASGKRMFMNMAVPLITGGIFILIILFNGHFGLAAPACLIFYGLALIQGSANTYDEIRYLGFSEIILGLISAMLPGYGLVFWALGFGVLHIVYGSIMYNKYDK